uniref:Uncharacterized protein n=1 Tax=Monodelphis domestica TaxID=13616 RepID=A0A5F8HG70_MONDO
SSPPREGYFISFFLFFKSLLSTAGLTCLSLNERLPLERTLWLYLIIIKFFCFFFSLFVELANGFSLVFFFTNSFLLVFPAYEYKTFISPPFHNNRPLCSFPVYFTTPPPPI